MKKLLAVFAILAAAAVLSFSSVGCGDGKTTKAASPSPTTKTPT